MKDTIYNFLIGIGVMLFLGIPAIIIGFVLRACDKINFP